MMTNPTLRKNLKLSTLLAGLSVLALTAVLPLKAAAATNALTLQAQQLAGQTPVTDPELAALFAQTNATWEALKKGQLAEMRKFSQAKLAAEQTACKTLFYPFGGPDVLNALTLFPSCQHYILFGLEPVGTLPNLSNKPAAEVKQFVKAMNQSQEYLLRRNFFVTQYMSKDFRSKKLDGVIPLISVTLARLGYELKGIEYKSLDGTPFFEYRTRDAAIDPKADPNAAPASAAEAKPRKRVPRAVLFSFSLPGSNKVQTLFYANFDASDEGLKRRPYFPRYMEKHAPTATLLKAASYLMHGPEFSNMTALVLSKSPVIVQDDTGLPYRTLLDAGYRVELFGNYSKPIGLFNYRAQPELAKAYAALPARSTLPFMWSYNVAREDMGLQLARKPAK
ncbi:hypothetical protein [Roseateles sp. PN1]|uniref:hypothetical protein n=1 Tax=Roseateles sp. PN1 TaxID=3137372 RepID=UPI00313882E8